MVTKLSTLSKKITSRAHLTELPLVWVSSSPLQLVLMAIGVYDQAVHCIKDWWGAPEWHYG